MNNSPVQLTIPDWFISGLTFKITYCNRFNLCTLESFDIAANTCCIEVSFGDSGSLTEDDWNLAHTIYGFENGEYERIINSQQ